MTNLRELLAGLGRSPSGIKKFIDGLSVRSVGHAAQVVTPLQEIDSFGSNPGNLRMFSHRPPVLADNPALVVVLHGCTQSAAGYDLGAGWSTLADRYGFVLVLPEQQRSNNPNGCFNWFLPEQSQRDRGEPLSIRQMIEKSVIEHGIDRRRVFITGLSAGGAMTSIMLACYPEVFAAGAIVAGLPYGAAANVQQAFESMFQSPSRPAREWGDLVRNASAHQGPWPRVSVWHGDVDKTVIPSNAREIIKQWTDVHGLARWPSTQAKVDGYPREAWSNAAGDDLVEAYTITNMAHGTPLAIGEAEGACGAAGPFLLQVGISSSYHIAKFFGIAGAQPRQRAPAQSTGLQLAPAQARREAPAAAAPVLEGEVLEGEVLDRDEGPAPHQQPTPPYLDVGAVINKALRTAGLIKG